MKTPHIQPALAALDNADTEMTNLMRGLQDAQGLISADVTEAEAWVRTLDDLSVRILRYRRRLSGAHPWYLQL